MLVASSNTAHARIIFSSDYLDAAYTDDFDKILNVNDASGPELELFTFFVI